MVLSTDLAFLSELIHPQQSSGTDEVVRPRFIAIVSLPLSAAGKEGHLKAPKKQLFSNPLFSHPSSTTPEGSSDNASAACGKGAHADEALVARLCGGVGGTWANPLFDDAATAINHTGHTPSATACPAPESSSSDGSCSHACPAPAASPCTSHCPSPAPEAGPAAGEQEGQEEKEAEAEVVEEAEWVEEEGCAVLLPLPPSSEPQLPSRMQPSYPTGPHAMVMACAETGWDQEAMEEAARSSVTTTGSASRTSSCSSMAVDDACCTPEPCTPVQQRTRPAALSPPASPTTSTTPASSSGGASDAQSQDAMACLCTIILGTAAALSPTLCKPALAAAPSHRSPEPSQHEGQQQEQGQEQVRLSSSTSSTTTTTTARCTLRWERCFEGEEEEGEDACPVRSASFAFCPPAQPFSSLSMRMGPACC